MFRIDPDIRRARTIPSEFYTEDRFWELSRERIFARTWQFAGAVPPPGTLSPRVLLEGLLDEPVLLSRDEKGGLLCLSNVCTHRGKILVGEDRRAGGIRCGYHGRRFGADGKFLSMPEFEGAEDFPTPDEDLSVIPHDSWANIVLASPDPAAPAQDFLGEMKEWMREFDLAGMELTAVRDYEVRAHWALYCENYLEGFHIPYVHAGLNEELDYAAYETRLFRYASLQIGSENPRRSTDGEKVPAPEPFASLGAAALYFFVFPNLMFNFYPWGLSLNIVTPLRKDLTRVSYLTCVRDGTLTGAGPGADLETVELEDQAVVESVQRGVASRFYDRGRYSPTGEQGTHHFHRLIAEFLES